MQQGGDFTIFAGLDHDGMRLDTVVAHEQGCSRHLAATLIKKGVIQVDGAVQKPSHRVMPGETISGHIPQSQEQLPTPEPIHCESLFMDDFLMVINKPPGIVVHPAPGHRTGTVGNSLLYHFPAIATAGPPQRPGIVHRLDRDTSGVMVVAMNGQIHEALSAMFKARKINKKYLALVYGNMKTGSGTIDLPIGRHAGDTKKMAVLGKKSRDAVTLWRVKRAFPDATLLELSIKTGRTHQIRVHCAAMMTPVVGDGTYKCRWTKKRKHFTNRHAFELLKSAKRQMLHAWQLEFNHPVTGEQMRFTAPVPDDMRQMLKKLANAYST